MFCCFLLYRRGGFVSATWWFSCLKSKNISSCFSPRTQKIGHSNGKKPPPKKKNLLRRIVDAAEKTSPQTEPSPRCGLPIFSKQSVCARNSTQLLSESLLLPVCGGWNLMASDSLCNRWSGRRIMQILIFSYYCS